MKAEALILGLLCACYVLAMCYVRLCLHHLLLHLMLWKWLAIRASFCTDDALVLLQTVCVVCVCECVCVCAIVCAMAMATTLYCASGLLLEPLPSLMMLLCVCVNACVCVRLCVQWQWQRPYIVQVACY